MELLNLCTTFRISRKPYLANGVAGAAATTHAVEEVLWANFLGAGTYDASANDFTEFTHGNAAAGLDITFANSNVAKLGTFDLIFMLGQWFNL